MNPTAYVDGLLVEWGDRFFDKNEFWGPPGRAAPARGSAIGTRRQAAERRGGTVHRERGGIGANAVRGRLRDLVRRNPEVMVRIYGGGKGMKEIRAHMRYVARAGKEGDLALEDQDGFRSRGREEIRELADDWQYGEVKIEETSNRREAMNIVLSMPEGTDPLAVKRAGRDFAERELFNHKYAMALHTIDTPHYHGDTNDPPSPNPHVHIIVQLAGKDGRRLNPRKEDLRRWRETFAQALRENGVEAVATSRAHRLSRGRGETQAVRQMKERKKPFTKRRSTGPSSDRVQRAKGTEKEILRRYQEVTQILIDSEDAADQLLAAELADRFGLHRPTPSPSEKRTAQRGEGPAHDAGPPPRGRTGTDDLER